MGTQYQEGQQVQVREEKSQRWLKARTLWLLQYKEDDEQLEAWECELRNGNRGNFDTAHMREAG